INFEGGPEVTASVADDLREMKQGLAGVKELSDNEGMLFVYKETQEEVNYWMKGMVIPIDIIWINENRVVGVIENIPVEFTEPLTIYTSSVPVDRVLEVRAGFAKKYGVKIGDRLDIQLQ
ncbi:MAG: hypothetical protein UU08_C0028G0013, partial [Candidatus Uhrbacteria bacterium GW2011_GWE2_40_58]